MSLKVKRVYTYQVDENNFLKFANLNVGELRKLESSLKEMQSGKKSITEALDSIIPVLLASSQRVTPEITEETLLASLDMLDIFEVFNQIIAVTYGIDPVTLPKPQGGAEGEVKPVQ